MKKFLTLVVGLLLLVGTSFALITPDRIITDSIKAGDGTLITTVVTVDCSTDSAGSTTTYNVVTIPIDSLILDVVAKVGVGFDGDAGTTFEVGVSGNIDKYIDSADFEPETHNLTLDMYQSTTSDTALPEMLTAAAQIQATWANYNSATVGSVDVAVTYITYDVVAD